MVQYYDNDFSFEDHEKEMEPKFLQSMTSTSATSGTGSDNSVDATADDDGCAKLHPNAQSKCWDDFHSTHSAGNFFKPRRYIMKCFPCILDDNSSNQDNGASNNMSRCQRKKLVLEIGCGSGSSCIPILTRCYSDGNDGNTILLACDCSPVAVDVCKSAMESSTDLPLHNCFGAFVSDPSLWSDEADTSFLQDVKTAHRQLLTEPNTNEDEIGLADIILMVFVLSAVPPKRVTRFMEQIFQTTRPNGKVCFRDYAVYDLPMMRFTPTKYISTDNDECFDCDDKPPRLFERGDGTLSRFFHLDTIKHIFESAGFETEELRYATVFNNNRKTDQKLKRVFVHGVFKKTDKCNIVST